MTNDEILEMAKAVGVLAGYEGEPLLLQIFAKEIYDAGASAERLAIYDIVMKMPPMECDEDEWDEEVGFALRSMAFGITAAIRARGQA